MITRIEAQDKVRDHLDKRGNHFVTVTEHLVRYWWRVCNVALFHGKLYPPKNISIKKFKSYYGYCESLNRNTVNIGISSDVITRKLFLTTLVHEMVHQWENQTHGRMGHGKRFFEWQKRVDGCLNLDLNVEYYEEDYFTYGQKQLYKRRNCSFKR